MSKKVSLARVDKELLRATTNMNWNLTAVDYVVVVGADYVNDPFTESPLEELQVPYPPVEVGGKKKLSAYFNEEEIECIRRIQGCGTRLYFQTLPYQAKDYGSFV